MTTTVENCTRARNEDGTVLLCSAREHVAAWKPWLALAFDVMHWAAFAYLLVYWITQRERDRVRKALVDRLDALVDRLDEQRRGGR